jgi:hypothetical protein
MTRLCPRFVLISHPKTLRYPPSPVTFEVVRLLRSHTNRHSSTCSIYSLKCWLSTVPLFPMTSPGLTSSNAVNTYQKQFTLDGTTYKLVMNSDKAQSTTSSTLYLPIFLMSLCTMLGSMCFLFAEQVKTVVGCRMLLALKGVFFDRFHRWFCWVV